MPQSATLQDVAVQAGVHRSTVSLALRNHPRISAEVRERVQHLARDLGYRSNPLVTALMRSRRTRQEAKHVVLAYVTAYPTRYGWRPPHHDRPDYFPGAVSRAQELGYKLEDFWIAEPHMTPERFAQVLLSRGINGVLVGRLPPGRSELALPWEHFSAVALGLTLKAPRLHHVAEDAFASAAEAMNQCIAAGHQRIGFVFSEPDDSPNTGDRYLGAFLRHQLRLPPERRLPPCEFRAPPEFHSHFLTWLDTHRPDVVLATHAEPIRQIFTEAKRKFSRSVKLVALVNDKLHHGFAGIHHDPGVLGALAVDMVVGMLHRGETGLPAEPHHVLVPGQWIDERIGAASTTSPAAIHPSPPPSAPRKRPGSTRKTRQNAPSA